MSTTKNIDGELKPTSSTFKWEIKNFRTGCSNVGDSLCSPVFQTSYGNKVAKWQLELFPKGTIEECKDFVSLRIKHSGESDINMTVILSILDKNNKKVMSKTLLDKVYYNTWWGYGSFIRRKFVTEESNNILINEALHVLCELVFDTQITESESVVEDSDNNKGIEDSKGNEPNLRRELDDFEKLLETEYLSDITFVTGENKIHLHKAILASRSSVFRAMFENETKEKLQSIIEIADIKYEVMKEVFRFIYASKINEIDKYSSDILVAAEKYSILGLKELCEKNLCSNLSAQNALEYLTLANTCNAIQLKKQAIAFIASFPHIVNSPEFKFLDPDLMCDVTRAIVEKNSQR